MVKDKCNLHAVIQMWVKLVLVGQLEFKKITIPGFALDEVAQAEQRLDIKFHPYLKDLLLRANLTQFGAWFKTPES
jgi:hypothetical protein